MKLTLTAPEMSCKHCKMTIEKAVKELSGINHVDADPNTKKVTVEFDEKTVSIEDIKSVIVDAGYEVED
jgi:copper chaperone